MDSIKRFGNPKFVHILMKNKEKVGFLCAREIFVPLLTRKVFLYADLFGCIFKGIMNSILMVSSIFFKAVMVK